MGLAHCKQSPDPVLALIPLLGYNHYLYRPRDRRLIT